MSKGKSMQVVVFVLYVVLSVVGVVLVKRGGENPLKLGVGEGRVALTFGYITLLGLLCYICSFLIYTSLIARYELNYIVPLSTGGIYLLTYAAAIGIFHEKTSAIRIIGSIVILAGIVMVSWKN